MLDRNARARLIYLAEALDRRTHLPGRHGGVLKRTGLAVLKALVFGFHNLATGRCDPGYDTIARMAGCGPLNGLARHRVDGAERDGRDRPHPARSAPPVQGRAGP